MRNSVETFFKSERVSILLDSSTDLINDNENEKLGGKATLEKASVLVNAITDVISQKTKAPAPHEQIVMGIVIIWVIVFSLVSLLPISQNARELTVGIVVNLNLLFFYGAPLSTIFTVIKTRNSVSIHKWTLMTNTANGAFWGVYGLARLDPFIYVPNLLGVFLGVVQIFLILTFPRKTKNEDPSLKQSEEIKSEP